jgi:hypothetical protein
MSSKATILVLPSAKPPNALSLEESHQRSKARQAYVRAMARLAARAFFDAETRDIVTPEKDDSCL